MQHDEFIGKVQQAAHLPSRGDAERATRVVLNALGERLAGGMPANAAAQLPPEIGRHLTASGDEAERRSLDDMFAHVRDEEGVELPDAVFHARAVAGVLSEAVSPGEMRKVMDQLPEEFAPLFAGSEGHLER